MTRREDDIEDAHERLEVAHNHDVSDRLYYNRFSSVPDEHDDRLDGLPVEGESML